MDADLTQNANDDESPDWHANALRQTEEDLKADKITVIDWEDAKKELRVNNAKASPAKIAQTTASI